MALRVDGVAMVSFITDSIVGEDGNDGAGPSVTVSILAAA